MWRRCGRGRGGSAAGLVPLVKVLERKIGAGDEAGELRTDVTGDDVWLWL